MKARRVLSAFRYQLLIVHFSGDRKADAFT
jgi:hypothetical protein